jgi:hypothetical protein
MEKTKLDETYTFKINMKIKFFWSICWYKKSVGIVYGYNCYKNYVSLKV